MSKQSLKNRRSERASEDWFRTHISVPTSPGEELQLLRNSDRENVSPPWESRLSDNSSEDWFPKPKSGQAPLSCSSREEESGSEHIQERPTNAFGTICFVGMGNKEAEYIRLSSKTRPEELYNLLTEQWKLPHPNLLISVTGGAKNKNFNLKTHLKNLFYRGLSKVAQTTGAWILTGGTHSGVVKHVGLAVRDQALSSTKSKRIMTIGVASWGSIYNKELLVHPEGKYHHAKYVVDVKGKDKMRCLDHNHTHFLLVDDKRGQDGAETELRAGLEKCISKKDLQENGVKIPVVLVVLNGDPGTLNTMYNAMQDGTACVVLEGSGGMADVVAHVTELPMSRVTIAVISDLMKKFFDKDYVDFSYINIIECTKKIRDIIRMRNLLTVFRVTSDSDEIDVDVTILQAILKASRGSEGGETYQRQLELTVAWNRVDIAKTEIFTDESQWTVKQLHDVMKSVLVGNKPEFVSLLLENGVSLMHFLQKDTLDYLYKNLPNCQFKRRMDKHKDQNQTFDLAVGVVRRLLKSYTLPILPNNIVDQACEEKTQLPDKNLLESGNPERDLFLWAILHCNKEIANIAWEECQDCMASALAASKMLKKLGEKVYKEEDADEKKGLMQLADLYEKRAIDVFNECYSSDKKRAWKLLLRRSPLWGGTSCLTLALEANNQNFIAQSGVQALLTQFWCGGLSVENPVWRVVVCIIFPPLVYTGFLDFRRDEEIESEDQKNDVKDVNMCQECSVAVELVCIRANEEEADEEPSRLVSLYTSLQVKCYMHIVSYFAFLTLFAVVLMVHFHPSPSPFEILLYVWIFTLVCEEIRQLFHNPAGLKCKKRLKHYIYDLWNGLDVLSIIFFIIGLALRMSDGCFYFGKIALCFDFVIFCLRFMAIFIINQTLGPKLNAVRRMIKDLGFFMFLLSIWVVAYGVAKQGILIDNEDRLDWILRGAVYEPYLILFGNMPVNYDHTEFDISTCSINGTDPLKPKCPVLNEDVMPAFPESLTIIMLCVYLLFANILLLNLLIAIFNFSFQVVQDNTDRIWKFHRYELIYEYHSRPVAPPPFIIFSHLYMILWAVLGGLQKACGENSKQQKERREEKLEEEEKDLLHWEDLMKDQCLVSTKQAQMQSTEQRIQDTADKVFTICDRLDREEDSRFGSVHKRLTRLEEKVVQLLSALEKKVDSLESSVKKAETAASQKETITEDFTEKTETDGTVTSSVPVPEEQASCEGCCYNPWYYLSPDEQANKDWPNPRDRSRPSYRLDLILTRVQRTGQDRNVQFLALKDKNNKSLIFPGGEVDSAGCFSAVLEKTMGNELCQKIKKMVNKDSVVHDGFVEDERNTDKAWVETTVLKLCLDEDSSLLTDINKLVAQTQGLVQSFEWHDVVSGKTWLSSHQRDFLMRVAQ